MTQICDHPLDNIYADMLRRSGMKFDSREELIDFLEAMMKAHDTVKARLATTDVDTCELDRTALTTALQSGDSIIDLAFEGGHDLSDIVRALANGQPSIMETWDEPFWAYVEETIMQEAKWSQQRLADALGLTKSNARTLLDWYEGRAARACSAA